jgi:hypothetical protein
VHLVEFLIKKILVYYYILLYNEVKIACMKILLWAPFGAGSIKYWGRLVPLDFIRRELRENECTELPLFMQVPGIFPF